MHNTMKEIWDPIICNVLKTQRLYLELTEKQFLWLEETLIELFSSSNIISNDSKYKCLVMLNRSKKYGRYALIFNSQIYEACINSDIDKLETVCSLADNPEIAMLENEKRFKWENEISVLMCALNLYVENMMLSNMKAYKSEKCGFKACMSESCSLDNSIRAVYTASDSNHCVRFAEVEESKPYITIHTMRELDLIFLILSDGRNPYTNKRFEPTKLKELENQYSTILDVAFQSYELGYDHHYMF